MGAALVILTVLVTSANFSWAQELQTVGPLRPAAPAASETSAKIVSRLRGLIQTFRGEGFTRANAAALNASARFSSPLLRVDNAGRVQAYVSVADTSAQTLGALGQLGFAVEIVNRDFAVVQGWIAVEDLEALAAQPVVTKIRPPSYATPRTGSVTSQGDGIHRCNRARTTGVTGAGITVGVISDGVDGLAASQATGDLPATVDVLAAGAGDEGTAMLEIVHDCAPGAALAFAAADTSLAFINAVNDLAAAGAQVIVDDLGFYADGYFEDDLIAQNDRTVGASALRVSAAGNDRRAHYQATFNPGPFDAQVPGTRHNFGGGDTLMSFSVRGQTSATLFLQWADPLGAAGNDYDLCVRQNGVLVACSADAQDGNDDPLEVLPLFCPAPFGSLCVADIQITLFSGAARPLELFCIPASCLLRQFNVPGDGIFGHPAVETVLAVAAANVKKPSKIEPFSSKGPSTILFPAPEVRSKPDITGVDCVATSRPGFNPFCGTSAAAPHVAAIAALALAKDPSLTLEELRALLKTTAVNLLLAGFDVDSGFGRADALNAVSALP